ncbi:MAG: MarR family transcriptional regulator [Bacilli bacterium]|nr:MarR family transcriptional regulator [Bacilli bacterium]
MENKYESLALKNQLCFPIYLCSKEIIRKYTPILEELDLTYTQYIVMMYFWETGKSNLKDIGKTLLLDPSTLTPLVKKLEKKGYLTRVRSTVDERNLEIELTTKGKELEDKALTVPKRVEKCIDITEEEAKILYKLMYKIIVNTQKEEK